ncbi:LytR/AlgR family response regulator transcription factor [Clostridium folliculivorans]|uniref:LytR/AlgR family response regulator transcription factor n=1 Tax=Clostridium folliculivorans TaxID=2886038 RepID=UPI0021C2B787|nr:LytTR family DNA-binding domain-containing protein [Clostridium folliculivorans]GKU29315.1 response regulator transcription factor [Clostridium folliculivorans]
MQAKITKVSIKPAKIKEYIENTEEVSYAMLEIMFNSELSGIDLACVIRKNNRDSYIVFATEHKDLIYKTFEGLIRPAGLLLKPVKGKEIVNLFKSAYLDYLDANEADDYLSVSVGAKLYKIKYKDILFLESAEKKIFINTVSQRIGFYCTLDSLELQLKDKGFIRTHNSFIVNKNHIENIDYRNMATTLTNGAVVNISRTYKMKVKESV